MLKQSQFNESEVPEATPETASAKKVPAFLLNKPKRQNLAYPDYARSLVSQRWQDPEETARKFALGSGATGAALGMLISRVFSNKASVTGLGGLAGGALGATVGYGAGRQSADSENSRTLWLRRKPGINDPGELESALRYGERPGESIAPRVKRAGVKQEILNFLLRNADKGKLLAKDIATGGAGLAVGEGMVRLGDYQDVPTASLLTRTSMPAIAIALRRNPALAKYLIGGLYGEQMGAGLMVAAKRSADASAATSKSQLAQASAVGEQAKALKEQVAATKDVAKSSLGHVLKTTLKSPAAMGTYAGLGAAGLGGLATGLTRAKTDEEIAKGTGRGKMIVKDFIQYALPLGLAGGVLGSLGSPSTTP